MQFPYFVFFMMGELRDVQGHLSRAEFNTREKGVLGFSTAKWASLDDKRRDKKPWLSEVEPFLQDWLSKNGKQPVQFKEVDKLAKRFAQHCLWLRERNEQLAAEKAAASRKARGGSRTRPRAPAKPKATKGGDDALEAEEMTPESTTDLKYALLVLRNSKEFFDVSRSTSYRNMHGLGLQVRAMWDIISDIHGPIYAQDAGKELRVQLLMYFNTFSAVNPTQVFTLERLTNLKRRTQFNNWQ